MSATTEISVTWAQALSWRMDLADLLGRDLRLSLIA